MAYATLLFLAVVDAAGYSVIAPVVPEIAQSTSASPAVIGALIASFPVGMALGFALAGAGVKRHGPETVILGALAVIVLGCAGFVFRTDLATFFIARFVMGAGSGGVWIGITFSTLERWPGQEYHCMGRIFAAYSAGGLVGPSLGAIDGIHGPFLAYAMIVCAALVLAAFLRPPARSRPFHADRTALAHPGFWASSAAILFTVLALGVVEGVLPLHLARRLDQTEIGVIYASVALLVAGSAAVSTRFAPRRVVHAAALLITTGLALAGATDTVWLWIAALLLTGTGIGLGNTGSFGLLLESVRPERIITAMIIWSQISIAGYLVGPVASGVVAEWLGFSALGLVPLVAALTLFGMLTLASKNAPTARASEPSVE